MRFFTRRGGLWAAGMAAAAALAWSIAWFGWTPPAPAFEEVRDGYRRSDARLLDRRGEVLHTLRVDLQGRRLEWTPLKDISPALRKAVLRAEDSRFYRHSGVDWLALAAGVWQTVSGGPVRGGSTVSMQLAALLDEDLKPSGRRSPAQKWGQMKAARALEVSWGKDQILEAYLNLVHFRGELQGIAAASRGLFGKRPHGLEAAEAALLAALIRSPNAPLERVARRAEALAPGAPPEWKQRLQDTASKVLSGGYSIERQQAWAYHAARRLLPDSTRPGESRQARSTLDGPLQRFAVGALAEHLREARSQNVRDGALLAADNASGEVLAYVGGSGGLSSARYVDGVQAPRQAGSTLKPFLYGLAFERRLLTPASLVEDEPLEMDVGGGLYRPQNYDRRFRGLVTARLALASSLNVPAVKTLSLVGLEPFAERLRQVGFQGLLEADFYGPSLALGSADVTLWDLVNAYRTLANRGRWSPLRLEPGESPLESRQAISPQAAFLTARILSDRESRSPTFGLESPLSTRFWSAVKTGTSMDMRDNWCIGFSREYTVGVWVGNFSGEPMRDVTGVTGAAPLWAAIMGRLHARRPSPPPPPPEGVVQAEVRIDPPGETRLEWFLRGSEPQVVRPPAAAQTDPSILVPEEGTIYALDPDIPARRQRLFFRLDRDCPPCLWRLDGEEIGPAGRTFLWPPTPGRHILQLEREGRVLHAVTFQVRGGG